MFKRILIVLEPDRDPEALIQRAVAMAAAGRAEIVCFTHLTRVGLSAAEAATPEVTASVAPDPDGRQRAENLHRRAREAADDAGVLCRSVMTTTGEVATRIVDTARATRCDLILAASDGANAVLRLLNGSVIPGLITASPMPVLVCAPQAAPLRDAEHAVRRILVILENHDASGIARAEGLRLARQWAAELHFVHIRASDVMPVVDAAGLVAGSDLLLVQEVQAQSHRLLRAACAAAKRAGLSARGFSLAAGTPGKDIAELAVAQDCDLMVVAHRGSNAVVRLLTGSLVPGLITAAAMPLLVCREPDDLPQQHPPRRRRQRHREISASAAARRPRPLSRMASALS